MGPAFCWCPGRPTARAFTLVEVLVSTAIVIILLLLMLSVISQTSSIWRRSYGSVEAFQDARLAFDVITRNLSQATLNAYLDYDNSTNPSRYLRMSELAFDAGPAGAGGLPGTAGTGQAVFFQAPLGYATNATSYGGLEGLLNTCGYFVSFTTNNSIPSHVAAGGNPYRYRLMQMLVPAEKNDIYKTRSGRAWFSAYTDAARPLADNIIALLIRPQDPAAAPADITTNYSYDTRDGADADPQPDQAHQLPPVILVTMVAVEEAASRRLDAGGAQPAAIAGALSGKFHDPALFQSDLDSLTSELNAARISYRVFSSAVPIRESKWTK